MADLGRVAITPADEFVEGKQYERLDMVTYGSGAYVAKEDNINILPTEPTIWMKMGEFATIGIMTSSRNGIGRPDNDTVKVNANGVFYSTCVLEKVYVIPTAENAVKNTIYLIKDDEATGVNPYRMYTLVGGEVVCINDISTDLSDYVLVTDFREHTDSSVVSADGVHDIRYYEGKFQGYDSDKAEWFDISTGGGGGGVDIGDVSGAAVVSDRTQAKLTWSDPEDVVLSEITLAKWGGTLVVRKEGSAPTDRNDGIKILDSKTRNAYSSTPYVDTGLEYGKTYYYRFFPYTTGGNYTDGSSVSIVPTRIVITTIPSQSGTLTYDTTLQTPIFSDYSTAELEIGGETTGTDAGTYTVTFTPLSDYEWSNGTRDAKEVNWLINKKSIEIPSVTDTSKIYNRGSQSPTIAPYNEGYISISGETTGTDAGNYELQFNLIDIKNTEWQDGTADGKKTEWTIEQADGSVTLSAEAVTLNKEESTATITTKNETGTLSVSSSDVTIATASIDDGVITISSPSEKSGSTTITVTIAESEDGNYSANAKTITVNANYLKIVSFSSGTDAEILALVQASLNGEIDLYEDCGWRVGDERTFTLPAIEQGSYVGESHAEQEVTVILTHHGQRDGLTYADSTAKNTDGTARNYPTFEWDLKNSLKEIGYMNDTNTNAGSWNGSKRKQWIPQFVGALPDYLKQKDFTVLTATEYNSTTTTGTTQKASFRAEKEIFGTNTYSGVTETNSLGQVAYYETSANRVKKLGNDGSVSAWWQRSPRSGGATSFCFVNTSGSVIYGNASYTRGLAPFGCIG